MQESGILVRTQPMKSRRQGAILELIESEPLHSQEQLRRRLLKAGFEATQATISRDIKELGLVKRSGDGRISDWAPTPSAPKRRSRPSSARPPNSFVASIGYSSWSSCARALDRHSRWRSPSTVPGSLKRSGRLPETTRFS